MRIGKIVELRTALAAELAPFVMLTVPLLALFTFPSMAGVVIAASLLFASPDAFARGWKSSDRRWLIALCALALWMATASFWSPVQSASLISWARLIVLCGFALAMFLSANELSGFALRRAALASVGGLFLCAVVIMSEPFTGADLYRLLGGFHSVAGDIAQKSNGETELISSLIAKSGSGAVFLAPLAIFAAIWLGRRFNRAAAIGFLLVAAAAIMAHPALAGKLSLVISAAVFALVYATRRTGARAFAAGISILVFAFPLAAPQVMSSLRNSPSYAQLDPASQHRVAIYEYVAGKAYEEPVFGFGFDASRQLSKSAPRADIGMVENASLLPSHPHNLALQAAFELGVVGAVLTAILLWRLGLALASGTVGRGQLAARFAVFAGLFSFAFVSFGAWRYEWLAAIFLVAFTAQIFDRDLQSD